MLFDPSIDPDISRQATYGKIAIGSGQLSGQGLTNGTMTQMQIVSENQTDYIFSVAGEELGFIGCMLIIGLLTLLILRLFYVSYRASTTFSSLLAVGVSGMFLFQTFMNIFMNVGLLPVMGLTLPFFSYVDRHHVRSAGHCRGRAYEGKAVVAAVARGRTENENRKTRKGC